MKSAHLAISLALVVATGAALGASACTAPQDLGVGRCDPDALFLDPECRDAGTDTGGADGSGGGSQLRAECAGRCLPRSFGEKGTSWSEPPISVWIGPKDLMPSCCPGAPGCGVDADAGTDGGETPIPSANIPTTRARVFSQIIAPPAECEPCECGASEGSCTGLPEKIEIRAGLLCDPNASSLPFSGPPGWNGSCSSDGALPAGQLCNGVLCAQSVWSPPLPGPTTESCTPKIATPNATIAKVDWILGALACEGDPAEGECFGGEPYCVQDPGLPWVQCVYRDGTEEPCPDNYNQGRYEMYPEDAVDDRGCEACSCGAPIGSGCLGKIPLYSDGACGLFVNNLLVSSMGDGCQTLQPPGIALGSKTFAGLDYMPGTCAASGGAPKGNAKGDASRVMTFCCAPFFNIPK